LELTTVAIKPKAVSVDRDTSDQSVAQKAGHAGWRVRNLPLAPGRRSSSSSPAWFETCPTSAPTRLGAAPVRFGNVRPTVIIAVLSSDRVR
jgi:hypothetical protein